MFPLSAFDGGGSGGGVGGSEEFGSVGGAPSLSDLEKEVAADLAGVKEMFKRDPSPPRSDSSRRAPEEEGEEEDVAEVEQDGGAGEYPCSGFHGCRRDWRWLKR